MDPIILVWLTILTCVVVWLVFDGKVEKSVEQKQMDPPPMIQEAPRFSWPVEQDQKPGRQRLRAKLAKRSWQSIQQKKDDQPQE